MDRRNFLGIFAGAVAAQAATSHAVTYFFAPVGGWKSDLIMHPDYAPIALKSGLLESTGYWYYVMDAKGRWIKWRQAAPLKFVRNPVALVVQNRNAPGTGPVKVVNPAELQALESLKSTRMVVGNVSRQRVRLIGLGPDAGPDIVCAEIAPDEDIAAAQHGS